MSALPREIHIKRKRGEEQTPDYLRVDESPSDDENAQPVESSKRRMSSKLFYQRRIVNARPISSLQHAAATQHIPAPETAPTIQTSKAGDERSASRNQPFAALGQGTSLEPSRNHVADAQSSAGPLAATLPELAPKSISRKASRTSFQPRRFHMSRSSMGVPASQSFRHGTSGVSKKSRYGPAVFVERGDKKAAPAKKLYDTTIGKDQARTESDVSKSSAPSFKKPSAKRLGPRSSKAMEENARNSLRDSSNEDKDGQINVQRQPLPDIKPMDNPDKIAADMDDWVLHEIGLNLKEIEKMAPQKQHHVAPSPSKFKPKAPSRRFAEREPELARRLSRGGAITSSEQEDDLMADADTASSDEDYEIVVYELAAPRDGGGGPALALGDIPPEEIGVLKFDSVEDMELFYGNEDDDSDWEPEDEEDENAENHYTAEYPEELDSEDSDFDGRDGNIKNGAVFDGDEEEGGGSDAGVDPYYRPRGLDYESDDGDYDDVDDRYIIEGDDESRDKDELYQEHIRRYIRRFGAG